MKTFECKMCGTCCYGEGGIFVEAREAERIADFLHLGLASFLSDYCEGKNGRVYIKTGPDGFCIFFNREKQCLIHPVKPYPCTLWPFYAALLKDEANWEMAKGACPGINSDCSHEEFVRQSRR